MFVFLGYPVQLVSALLDGDCEEHRRQEAKHPSDSRYADADSSSRPVPQTILPEQSTHGILDLVPLVLERVVILPINTYQFHSTYTTEAYMDPPDDRKPRPHQTAITPG